ncbi:MAG: formyl-CoA transferase [Armatimonadetes bacterium CG07_land_8_20_14_0_80_40_9]|nr:MAG: formyl-CoA transferase [Armatimonadetes bacterium CG07_land_8_20_14_0_80_40_9]
MSLPLEGIKVLDLSRLLPGGFCTLLLADMGAEVVKVEDPKGGDYIRWMPPFINKESAYFLALNRNKKSIKLNLRSKMGKEVFLKLSREYDVILEGFRPGVVNKLGISYEEIKRVNPKIIYCSLSGFGQDGPYRERVGHDINYIGIGGILSITGEKGGPPVIPGVQIADIGGGMLAAIAILASLVSKERGEYIDVSMLDGVISWLVLVAGKYFADGKIPQRGEMQLSGELLGYNVYPTKDGKSISLGALEPKFWQNFCQSIKREDLIDKQFAEGEEKEKILKELKTLFQSKTQDEWGEFFKDKEVCSEPVNDLPSVFSHPQVKQRQMLFEIDHPTEGPIKQIGLPIKFSSAIKHGQDQKAGQSPGVKEVRKNPPPGFGEHTEEILKSIGYSQEEIEKIEREES